MQNLKLSEKHQTECPILPDYIQWIFSPAFSKRIEKSSWLLLTPTMITLWENRDHWEKDSNLHALLLTIIKNKSLNILEHKQIRLRAEEDINSHSQRELNLRISTLKACEPEQIFDNEIQHIVHKALEHMPQQSRTIFMLSRYQNLPNRQIAEQLHISLKTVEAHITKALRILRLELKDYLASILL